MQSEIAIRKQNGFTALQIVIGLALIGFALTCVLKILPVYIDNYMVQDALKELGQDSRLAQMSKESIVQKLKTQFDLNGVRGAPSQSIKVRRRSEGWLINIDYEERVPFMGNLDVMIRFQNQLDAAAPDKCCEKIIPDVVED